MQRSKSPVRPARAKWRQPKANSPALPPCLEEFRRTRLLAQRSRPQSPVFKASQREVTLPSPEGDVGLDATGSSSHKALVSPTPSSPDLEPHRPLSGPLLPPKEKAQKEIESLADIVVAIATANADGGEKPLPADLQATLVATASGPDCDASRDNSPQKHPSVAVVVDCLEAVLMKGIEPLSRVTNEKLAFVDRTLSSVVDAASWQLQATKARRRELLIQAEELRAALQRKEFEFEEAQEKVAKVFYRPKRQAMKAEVELEAAAEEVESLEARLQIDTSNCADLRERVSDVLHVAREDWRKEREQLVSERDSRLVVLAELNEMLPSAETQLSDLEHEVEELTRKGDIAEKEALSLPDAKERLEAMIAEHERVNTQVREARTKLEAKKPRRKKK